MRKNRIREWTVLCMLALLGRTMPVYAGWTQQDGSWRYEGQDNLSVTGWLHEEGGWYYFDEGGRMVTGWREVDGFWYFFNPVSDGSLGRMMTGWQWVDGKCYYLAEVSADGWAEGSMYAKTQTPDGSQVDETGAWIDETGIRVTVPGKGIMTKVQGEAAGKGKIGGGGGGSSGKRGGTGGNKNNDRDLTEKEKEQDKGQENRDLTEKEKDQENGTKREETGKGEKASPSDADRFDKINWQVRFVDADSHQIALAIPQKGIIDQGKAVTVNFKSKIIDSENRIWESLEKPPLEFFVYGPGDELYEVEYRQTGIWTEVEEFAEEKESLRQWIEMAKHWEAQLTGEAEREIPDSRILVWDDVGNEKRLLTAAGQILDGFEAVVYVIGKNREPDGRVLKTVYGEKIVYSQSVEETIVIGKDRYVVTRFAINRKTDFSEPDPVHWDIGDVWEGQIDGVSYTFRCIDQDYSDKAGNHREGALFLCDQVIPADFGSFYSYEKGEDGTSGYVFYPGPIVNFGNSNDYKYSRVRKWLREWEKNFDQAKDVDVGVSYAYTGSTGEKNYSQLSGFGLSGSYIGSQKLTEKLFVMSVDEALKYRDWLWRFDGSDEENPESQYNGFSKGYWLRNPMGTAGDHDTGFVYVVDLVKGNIRPMPVAPTEETEDEELNVTGVIGVRPAFVMAQK